MLIRRTGGADGAAKTDDTKINISSKPQTPERHRLRTLNDFEDELLDDWMAAYPAGSGQDFFTRFFNRFYGNPDNQQQRFLYRFDQNGPARTRWILFELFFSKPRVRDRTDDNPIAG